MKTCKLLCLTLVLLLPWSGVTAESRLPEDHWRELLETTREAAIERQVDEEARLQLQREAATAQAQALANARAQLAAAEQQRNELEARQEELEATLATTREQLSRRSASLGEVFSVYREERGSFHALLLDALFSLHNPELLEKLQPGQGEEVPAIADLRDLWKAMQQAWLASGQLQAFTGPWIDAQGQQQESELLRVGDLQLLNSQGLLRYERQQPPQLWSRQPDAGAELTRDYLAAEGESLLLDPARGQTLNLYNQQPGLLERLQQGGLVGYLILFLGVVGLLVAAVQYLRLSAEKKRLKKQLQALQSPQSDNLLGRILVKMQREAAGKERLPEALEARLDELLLKEAGQLDKGLSWVKLLAAIAPLLGLLGTVTGMIATFQAITLFGTSDPSMMASGISQALMTTVLGLITAVPLLLAHLLLQGRCRHLARILEAETSAWLAGCLGSERERPAGDPS
ncbi:MotA/TolQ/ExbB proton channel family protein [Marinospirillum perlucidum]|uniref:MotA/TolQ/ExbB proton channel family protein n=1 Tax=Marinospirillum perlucidum TaxID=1982602 RepID=UPI000DF466CD|nr:MotA/TolQ/ExbB proton channel family protein [Marinospirillum perlucidum]